MRNILFKLSDVYCGEKIDISAYDTEKIIGGIIRNRIVGIAYDNLETDGLQREYKKALRCLLDGEIERSKKFKKDLRFISHILKDADFRYALLKGAYLGAFFYKEGRRTSNDIDILIDQKDIDRLQSRLSENGFIQGYVKEGKIVPATRAEIINSRINRGETVPFLIDNENGLLEVDINFSVDFKASDERDTVRKLLGNCVAAEKDGVVFYTLCPEDFLIHLCCHLFKEATTIDWVEDGRDLLLYKFSDINILLHRADGEVFFTRLVRRIKDLGTEMECYYTFYNSGIIYPSLYSLPYFGEILEEIRPGDVGFLKQVICPKEKKTLYYTVSFEEWFGSTRRPDLLLKER